MASLIGLIGLWLLAAAEFMVASLCHLCWATLCAVLMVPRIATVQLQHPYSKHNPEYYEVSLDLDFDVFRCQQGSGSVLTAVTHAIMHMCGLLEAFGIDGPSFAGFLVDLDRHYDASNPYHNTDHVADVVQTLAVITSGLTTFDITPTERLMLFLAAACHDVGHRGVNNQYYHEAQRCYDDMITAGADMDLSLIRPELSAAAEYAAEAGSEGVNELHHVGLGLQLLERHGLLQALGSEEKVQAQQLFRSLILATDMRRHDEVLAAATAAAGSPHTPGSRTAVLSALLHIADIFNPCRSADVAVRFGGRVALELAEQGLKELEVFGSVVHPYCSIAHMCTPQGQKQFITSSVLPALDCLRLFAPVVADGALNNLQRTVAAWNALQGVGMQQPLPDAERTVSQLIQEVEQFNQKQQQQQHHHQQQQQHEQLEEEDEEERELQQQLCRQAGDEQHQMTGIDEYIPLSRSCSASAGSFISSRANSFPVSA